MSYTVSYKEVKYSDQSQCCNFLSSCSCSWNWLLPLQYCSILKSDELFKFQIEHQIRAHIDIIVHWLLKHSICICDVVTVQPTCLASAAPSNAVGRDPATSGWSDWQLTELTVDPPMPKMGTLWGPIVRTDVKAKTTLSAPFFHSISNPIEISFCHNFSCIRSSVCALKICWLNGCHQDIFVTSQS